MKVDDKKRKKKKNFGSEHTPYKLDLQYRFREQLICHLIEKAVSLSGIPRKDFRILDIGSGSGHLLKTGKAQGLDIRGADLDPVCVTLSGRFAETTQIGPEPLAAYFEDKSFDCLVFSHSLEHFDSPLEAVLQAKRISRQFLIIAVPNPCRFQTIFVTNVLRYDYSNLGHLCCWDHSHLRVFITERCGLNILQWPASRVGLLPIPTALVKALKKDHPLRQQPEKNTIDGLTQQERPKTRINLIRKMLDPVEMFLARVFPYFADEFIVLAEISGRMKSVENAPRDLDLPQRGGHDLPGGA